MNKKANDVTQNLLQFYDKPVAKVSLELVFSIVMVTFFAAFAIRPTLLTMSNLIKEIQDKQQLDDHLKQKIAALSSAQNEYLAAESRLAVLDEAIPSTPEVGQTLTMVERLASDRNVTITSITAKDVPKEATNSADFRQLKRISRPIVVTVTGDYPTIRQFVSDIQNVRRTLIVDNIIFTVTNNRTQKRLQAAITISMQYFGVAQ